MRAKTAPVRLLSKVPMSANIVAVGVLPRNGKDEIFALEEMGFVQHLLSRADVTSAPDSVTRIPDPTNDKRSIIFTGVGPEDVSADTLRYAVGAAMRKSGEFKSLAIALPTTSLDEVGAIIEGALLGTYSFDEYRSTKPTKKGAGGAISVVTSLKSTSITHRAETVAEAVALVKDLVNTPPNDLSPAELAKRAVSSVAPLPIRAKVWDERQLHRDGFGALGTRYTGVMGDDGAVSEIVSSADESGELCWPMPLPQELKALLKSDVADLVNAKVGNTAGGMLLGAMFLRQFVTKTPWVHIDAASSANNAGSPFGFTGAGPTGTAVRALIRQAERAAGK
jgi:leucyl aminopeptidase